MTSPLIYCIDSSSLLEGWVRSYRPVSFPSFWEKLDRLIADGRCRLPEEVRTEIERKSDLLRDWIKERPAAVVPFDRQQEEVVQRVMSEYPRIVNIRKNAGWADPFLIALAACRGYTVVTEEKPGTREGPKIPFVCKQYGIGCIDLASMIEQEQWRF